MSDPTDRIALLERRVTQLERELGFKADPERPQPPPSLPLEVGRTAARTAGRALPPAPHRTPLEDVLGGRVLAYAGGVTVLVGIVLLFAVAVSRGWIGEGARTLAGGLLSLTLAMLGTWLHEAKGRTDAALAALGAGLAGLVVTAVVATRVYELIPVSAGLVLTLATAVAATALAIRWQDAQGLAALGILGGLAAPVLVGAPQDGATTALLALVAVAATAVCVARRWDWLGLGAFFLTTGQWAAYALAPGTDTVQALFTLLTFGAIAAAAAIGSRSRTLLALDAAALAAAGVAVFGSDVAWLSYLAGAHAGAALVLLRHDRRLAATSGVLAVVLTDLALAEQLSGPPLALAFAALALAAGLAARTLASPTLVTLANAHLALAIGHVLLIDAPPTSAGTQALIGSLLAAGGVALVVAGLLEDRRGPREAGLAILTAVLAKVVLYDLRALTPMARVGSFLALGLLLLAGSYAWQRIRPASFGDPVSE